MATYSASLQAVHKPSAPGPYIVENIIDIAVENAANAAALAANDVLEIFTVPANTLILAAGIEQIVALVGESNDTTWNLGLVGASTGGSAADVDLFAAVWDGDAAVAGYYSTPVAANLPAVVAGSTTIDLELQAAGTAPTAGSIRVWAVMMDIDGRGAPATGARYDANEVDRDLLA
tara:strand:+ start:122 stop:649 length:528 start_codon:yes stop_codon:yes gene_type:complete